MKISLNSIHRLVLFLPFLTFSDLRVTDFLKKKFKFERCFENDYDIHDNERYNRWLIEYHPGHVHSVGDDDGEHVLVDGQESVAQRVSFSLGEFFICQMCLYLPHAKEVWQECLQVRNVQVDGGEGKEEARRKS